MTTSDLAARLYERWRQGQDFYAPADAEVVAVSFRGDRPTGRRDYKPRPIWRHLDTVQQNVWRAVALEATSVTAGTDNVVGAHPQAQT